MNSGMEEMETSVCEVDGKYSDEVKTRFGIREITSDQCTPDQSRQFYVNGKKIFIRGTNWIPEAMLCHSDERTYAELRYTQQSGIIKLRLNDEKGNEVANNFYWRSNDKYEGSKTLTGPVTSGFESLSELLAVKLKSSIRTYRKDGRHYLEVKLKNTTGKLAFFTQLQLLDEAGKPIRPSFYTDNFFSPLPNESKTIIIDTRMEDMPSSASFVIKGWNVIERNYVIMQNRY